MRHHTSLQVITYRPDWYTAKVFIQTGMAPNKCVHFHSQVRLHIGVLAVRKSIDKQVYGNYFAVPLVAVNVFLKEQFKCHADFLQLLMYVVIIRVTLHGLVHIPITFGRQGVFCEIFLLPSRRKVC